MPEDFTGTIDWGDGSPVSSFLASATAPSVTAPYSAEHTYAAKGVYTITVTASDGDDPAEPQTTTVQVGDLVISAYQDDDADIVSYFVEPPLLGETAYLDLITMAISMRESLRQPRMQSATLCSTRSIPARTPRDWSCPRTGTSSRRKRATSM